jgi:PAS domain-containing protein
MDDDDVTLGTKILFTNVTHDELKGLNLELRARGIDLSRSNLFLSGILRTVPDGVIVMDKELHIELWNDVAGHIWGVKQAEVKGKPVQATNRHGRRMTLRIVCASVGESADDNHGAILLMQEVPATVH